MEQQPSSIKEPIDEQRSCLRDNLQEIEDRVTEATNIRAQYDKNPLLFVGAAFAGGLLLAALGGSTSVKAGDAARNSFLNEPVRKFSGTLDAITGAFAGLAASKLENYIAALVPGFHEQFQKASKESDHYTASRKVSFG